MKKIILLTFSVLMIAGLAWATNSVNSIEEDTRICEQQTQIDSTAPVKVAFYRYNNKTGETVCGGFGYVRTENGKMLIYTDGSRGADYPVRKSNLRDFQYMFTVEYSYGPSIDYYFNL